MLFVLYDQSMASHIPPDQSHCEVAWMGSWFAVSMDGWGGGEKGASGQHVADLQK